VDRAQHIPVAASAAATGILVDQLGKTLVRANLRLCTEPPIRLCDRIDLPGPLGILRTENPYGALGLIDAGSLGIVALAAIVIIALAIRRSGMSPFMAISVGLFIGGSLANLLDRLLFGSVTDFIDLRWGLAEASLVLNPADIALIIGAALFWCAVLGGRASRRSGLPVVGA